ncbi:hypothetical protein AB0M43_15905 [Longispora sp. NPDC051575]|uniref:hypothetical protein n=1 Tax=Longispora sp. NPDC051575 TaxID=3154943 RepID=UPI003415FEE7
MSILRYMSDTLDHTSHGGRTRVARRRIFDPATVVSTFWRRNDVRLALARRDIGGVFRHYVEQHPQCTQTQLALLTEHDRSDISNWLRGTRTGKTSDIDVLNRIADGLQMPDDARVLMGLAPADVHMSELANAWAAPVVDSSSALIAICGSRAANTDESLIDASVRALSVLLMRRRCVVNHGPVGVGIEVMTYLADHFRPPSLTGVTGIFGRPNVIRNADLILVVGGAQGTLDEANLALASGKVVVPFPASGGTASQVYQAQRRDPALHDWASAEEFATLGVMTSAEDYARFVEHLLNRERSHD